jgi:hypothetical protein
MHGFARWSVNRAAPVAPVDGFPALNPQEQLKVHAGSGQERYRAALATKQALLEQRRATENNDSYQQRNASPTKSRSSNNLPRPTGVLSGAQNLPPHVLNTEQPQRESRSQTPESLRIEADEKEQVKEESLYYPNKKTEKAKKGRKVVDVDAVKRISTFIQEMVDENEPVIRELKKPSEKEKNDQENRQRKKDARALLESMLENNSKIHQFRKPLWRHKMEGNLNPNPDELLKGKALFRVAVYMVIFAYTGPYLEWKRKKLASREKETNELNKALTVFADSCDTWVAKSIEMPLLSITRDRSLDFNPEQLLVGQEKGIATRMMQFKVRLKALINDFINAEKPGHILDFLGLLVFDGNYFADDFLPKSEKESLEFDQFGGTRNMFSKVSISEEEKFQLAGATSSSGVPKLNLGSFASSRLSHFGPDVIMVHGELLRITRVKMILMSYVYVRILIGHVILSPWYCNIGAKHDSKDDPSFTRRKVYNLRILASIVYEILRRADPQLPPVSHQDKGSATNNGGGVKGGTRNDDGDDTKNADGEIEPVEKSFLQRTWEYFTKPLNSELLTLQKDENQLILEQLLKRRRVYESVEELHEYLFPSSFFDSQKGLLDEWTSYLFPILSSALNSLSVAVLHRKLYPGNVFLCRQKVQDIQTEREVRKQVQAEIEEGRLTRRGIDVDES